MKPWYGPAVRLEEPLDFSVVLRDYGTDWKLLLEESARDHVLVTAVTDSAWEACYIQRAVLSAVTAFPAGFPPMNSVRTVP